MVLRLVGVVVPTLEQVTKNQRKSSKRKKSSDEADPGSDEEDRPSKRRATSGSKGIWSAPPQFKGAELEREGPELVLEGETPEDDDEVDVSGTRVDDKTVRILRDFAFFDVNDIDRMVPLDAHVEDGTSVEGAGFVAPVFVNDEDEGNGDDEEPETRYIRLGAIFGFWVDYASENGAIWVETQFSWYILENSSEDYATIHQKFMTPHRITQVVLNSATRDSKEDYQNFLRRSKFNYGWNEGDLLNSVSTIQHALSDALDFLDTEEPIPMSRVLKKLLPTSNISNRFIRGRLTRPRFNRAGTSDIHASKRVNPTHVTPLIASLAGGLVREALQVVGKKPSSKSRLDRYQQDALPRLLKDVGDENKFIELLELDTRDAEHGVFYSRVKVGSEMYQVGDVVLTPREDYRFWEPHHIFADHFWFGRIIYIDGYQKTAHLHYLSHGSHFDLGEVAHPYELFLDQTCVELPLTQLAGKVDVTFIPVQKIPPTIPSNKFYVRYCTEFGPEPTKPAKEEFARPCILALTQDRYDYMNFLSSEAPPPDNCPNCIRLAERQGVKVNKNERSFEHGGHTFHLHDFILYSSNPNINTGPGRPVDIGQLVDIKRCGTAIHHLSVVQLGRIRDVEGIPPEEVVDSERHLFTTPITEQIRPTDVVRPCFMFPFDRLSNDCLDDWLDMSPYHFFLNLSFPARDKPTWTKRSPLNNTHGCGQCVEDNCKMFKDHANFLAHRKHDKLSTLDLFGGCGALGLGLADGSQSLEITHAIEILPSSARTYENSRTTRKTKVYNQCVNTMLKYAIKDYNKLPLERPKQLWDGETDVPSPPRPGDVQVIVAGFPCQTFSHLNRFKQEGSVKSNLILNALSWVDFLKPKYCLFENVPAFKEEKLSIPHTQRTDGIRDAVQSGYFKLLLRALLEMGYQVRHGVLQAGEYGTPQNRERFFLIAAKGDLSLPELPEPTHFFPTHKNPSPKYNVPHHIVTINDAISDLQPFDCKTEPISLFSTVRDLNAVLKDQLPTSVLRKRVSRNKSDEDQLPTYNTTRRF
ncbi:hypothetical protein PQX77_010578 [Marasmius sp. AFHP31]|nr:hypothetical protein PQX77_010578 [Marasmius sp. AFHP31]